MVTHSLRTLRRQLSMPIKVYVRQATSGRNHQLFYVDPGTGKRHHKSAGTRDTRAAQRAAARWEDDLNKLGGSGNLTLEEFRQIFEDEKLIGIRERSQRAYTSALNKLEKFGGAQLPITEIDAKLLSRLQARMKASGLSDASIVSYIRHIRSALSWGVTMGYLARVPRVVLPKTPRKRLARGRPLTWQEVVRIIHAIDVPERDTASWRILLRGLYLSGLRLSEALQLSWDQPPVMLDLDHGTYPRIIWQSDGQKSGRDEVTPVSLKFVSLVEELPKTGTVLRPTLYGRPASLNRSVRLISKFGKSAGVYTVAGRTATAHDFRRSFGQYWATKLKPLQLQKLMRHSTLDTTLKYYVDLPSEDLAAAMQK